MDSTPEDNENTKTTIKSRRITQACDYCHRRSKRCKPTESKHDKRCQNCIDFRQPCTYDRPVRRRGVKTSRDLTVGAARLGTDTLHGPLPARHNPTPGEGGQQSESPDPKVQNARDDGQVMAVQIAPQAVIMDLIEIYFEVVYPIFPYFHRPTFLRRVARAEYLLDRSLYATTMAACALASARVRDGAVFSPKWDVTQLQNPKAEVFFAAAESAIPKDLSYAANDHHILRACALLAIASIQDSKLKYLHLYMGHFFTLVAMDGLQHESNWPKNIGLVELEERRRVFWSVYTIDVYTSVIWSGVIRCREAQADVAYPTEMDDDMFDDNGYNTYASTSSHSAGTSPSTSNPQAEQPGSSWLSGWNFATDLYRILEHANDRFRTHTAKQYHKTFLHDIFGDHETSQSTVLHNVMQLYANLPQRFKQVDPITLNMNRDRFSFQSANITATIQLLRMVLFTAGGATLRSKCQVASEVVNSFLNVPVAYLRAISSPILYHLSGIGSLLGSVFEQPLCEMEYLQVRTILLSMAQLLDNVDLGLPSSGSASERLRTLVSRIDEYMSSMRRQHQQESNKFPQSALHAQLEDQQHSHAFDTANIGSATGTTAAAPTNTHPSPLFQQLDTHTSPPESLLRRISDGGSGGEQSNSQDSPTDPMLMPHSIPPELLDVWPWDPVSGLFYGYGTGTGGFGGGTGILGDS